MESCTMIISMKQPNKEPIFGYENENMNEKMGNMKKRCEQKCEQIIAKTQ